MKKNKRSITLTAVILLIIVICIAIFIIVGKNMVNSVKQQFINSAVTVLNKLKEEQKNDSSFEISTVSLETLKTLNLTHDNYEKIQLGTVNNKLYIIVNGKNDWENLKVCGSVNNLKVVAENDNSTCKNLSLSNNNDDTSTVSVNKPVLSKGMTPVKWNGTNWVKTTSSDKTWYNYDKKEWANAKTADDSMWVWIPRYIYKISSGWHTTTTGTIDVKFSNGTDDTLGSTITLNNTGKASDSNGTWTSHPAFTFGDTELTGIWVAKFEATAAEGITNNAAGDNTTAKTVKSVPNVQSWRYISTDYMFKVSRNMEINKTYGWGTTGSGIDTHVIKNIEWGAIAYLSKSIYGQEKEKIWNNPNSSYLTGCAGTSALASSTSACEKYDTVNGGHASTTGNIYGVYDMVGGTWERTLGNYNDTSASSGIASVSSIEDKYIDRYNGANRGYNDNTKGDAVYETSVGATYNGESWDGSLASGWDGSYAAMPYTALPWFGRGGVQSSAKGSGIFNFVTSAGNIDNSCTFRPVLLVNNGL